MLGASQALNTRIRVLIRDRAFDHEGCPGLARTDVSPGLGQNLNLECGCGFETTVSIAEFTSEMLDEIYLLWAKTRMAQSLGIPPEVATGLADANHWSAWARSVPESAPEHVPDATDRALAAGPPEHDGELAARDGRSSVQAKDPLHATLAPLDATQIYTPPMLEKQILDLVARLERGAVFEREVIVKHYELKTEFDRALWRAMLEADGRSADVRKAQAMLACEAEDIALTEVTMMREAVKSTMHNLRATLSGLQSVMKSVMVDYQAGGAQR